MSDRRGMQAARLALGPVVLTLCGCYASNVVAPEERDVASPAATFEWQPAEATDVVGFWISSHITGDAAASLLRVLYLFENDGRYTAAALVAGESGPSFQTLDGSWSCAAGQLVLDGAPARPSSVSNEHLRIEAESGTLVLRRMGIQ